MTALTEEEFQEARHKMVRTQFVSIGVQRQSLIDAASKTPREKFIPEEFKIISYSAKEIPFGKNRYVLNPSDLGLILDRIEFENIQKILIIADSSGYVSALLSDLIPEVYSVDSVDNFKENVDSILNELEITNVTTLQGDITKGAPAHGPYDLVFINGAVQFIPDDIFNQLSEDGKILTAIKKPFISHAVLQYKLEGATQTDRLFECNLSILPEFSKKSKFVF